MADEDEMQFPPLRKRVKVQCDVDGCSSTADENPSLRFHLFPSAKASKTLVVINDFGTKWTVDRREAWKIKLRVNKRLPSNAHVCSLHFTKDDYLHPDLPDKKRDLKSNAVPSCNLPKGPASGDKEENENVVVCQTKQQPSIIKYEIMVDDENIEDKELRLVSNDEFIGDLVEQCEAEKNDMVSQIHHEQSILKYEFDGEDKNIEDEESDLMIGYNLDEDPMGNHGAENNVALNQTAHQQSIIKCEFDIEDNNIEDEESILMNDDELHEDLGQDDLVEIQEAQSIIKYEIDIEENEKDEETAFTAPQIETFDISESEVVEIDFLQSQEKQVPVTRRDFDKYKKITSTDLDEKLDAMTGIPNFAVLNDLVKIIIQVPAKVEVKLSPVQKVIMTFMKLKQNITIAVLAEMFGCSNEQNCKLVIFEILDVLSTSSSPLVIYWPSKSEVMQNIPDCFVNFVNIRCIIDCIEVGIEKPKKKITEFKKDSGYKNHYTVKFMIGVTPGGLISFVSKAHGETVSNRIIFEQSDIMDLLEKNDGLMADEDFLVDDICNKSGVHLVRPGSLPKRRKCLKSKAQNLKLPSAKEYVERSHQRLKSFKIINDKLPGCFLTRCEQIVKILCVLINLS